MYQYKTNVVRIIDGDSAVIDIDLGFKMWRKQVGFRLYGFQAPELRSSDPKEKWLANQALEILNSFIPTAIPLVFDSRRDETGKYGRVLGNIRHESVKQLDWTKILLDHEMLVEYGTEKKREREYWHQLYEKLN